jgi:signal transduction histidine kinase
LVTTSQDVVEDEDGNEVPIHDRPTQKALETGKLVYATYIFVRKDKTKFPVAINVTPIKLDGVIIGAIDTFRDITREKGIDRAKSEFVSLASHQLRTPLGISKWYIEAIKTEGYLDKVPDIAKDYFNEIYKSNERLLVLVRDLLSISRIDQGKVKNTPSLVNVPELITTITKSMSVLAKKNNITINLDLKKSEIPEVLIDPLRLQEVIENLITNAVIYSAENEKVDVNLDKKNGHLVIRVKDTGIGISAEDKKKLFTKFFRSEKAVMKNTEGSGLGLYVVKSYVDGWGGSITVESSENKGSTFIVTVPLVTSDEK